MSNSPGLAALMRHPGFVPLWAAAGLSTLGTSISALAFQLLMIEVLRANQFEIGLVRSAQWLPCLLFGLFAGVIADRIYRKHLLIGADVVSGLLMLTIAVLALTGGLSIGLLAAFAFLLGCVVALYGGAFQSLTADLLPPRLLSAGNVVQTQTYTASVTTGPMISGLVVRVFGAPLAIAIDAFSYLASAFLLWRMPDVSQERIGTKTSIVTSVREGLAWVYHHGTLAPYALTLHTWFIGNNICRCRLCLPRDCYRARQRGDRCDPRLCGNSRRPRGHICRAYIEEGWVRCRRTRMRLSGWRGLGARRGSASWGDGIRSSMHRTTPLWAWPRHPGPADDELSQRRNAFSIARSDEHHDPLLQLGPDRGSRASWRMAGAALRRPDRTRNRRSDHDRFGRSSVAVTISIGDDARPTQRWAADQLVHAVHIGDELRHICGRHSVLGNVSADDLTSYFQKQGRIILELVSHYSMLFEASTCGRLLTRWN